MENVEVTYKNVSYKKFITELKKMYDNFKVENKTTESHVAVCLQKSNITVRNCFNLSEQVVSDKILTQLMKCIDMDGKIEWVHGSKYYYLVVNE
jgi:hypothetical protein